MRDIVLMKLNAVGLRGARAAAHLQVSGGMARRIALARCDRAGPRADHTTSPSPGLDPSLWASPANLIRKLNDTTGVTS